MRAAVSATGTRCRVAHPLERRLGSHRACTSAHSSIFAPIDAAFFICASLMPTTSNCACVTTIRSQPSSRAAAMRASACSARRVAGVDDEPLRARTPSAPSRTAGSTAPRSSTTRMPEGAVPARRTWLSASKVGNHTTRPWPPCIRHIHSTACALMPADRAVERRCRRRPSRPATCLRASHARSAVRATWFLNTTASICARRGQPCQLVVVHGAAEDVGRGVRVEVDEAADGADGWGRRRVPANARRGRRLAWRAAGAGVTAVRRGRVSGRGGVAPPAR